MSDPRIRVRARAGVRVRVRVGACSTMALVDFVFLLDCASNFDNASAALCRCACGSHVVSSAGNPSHLTSHSHW